MTGDDFRKTIVWWLVLGILAGVITWTFINNRDSKCAIVDKVQSRYDYVIIGAGTSGSVLANRLSEDPSVRVLVLEAGGDESREPNLHVPLLSTFEEYQDYEWMQYTIPQKYAAAAMNERRIKLIRGRSFGGTSLLNNMLYLRGSRLEYDEWSKLGCKGWGFRDVIPYFLKSEDAVGDIFSSSAYHSTKGPLSVSSGHFYHAELDDSFREASEQLGYGEVDCNGKDAMGYCRIQSTTIKGERASTTKAYLRPVMGKQNLHIGMFSHVTKVLISNRKAVGVEFLKNGRKTVVGADREVILAAGPIGSPHILMLSGIGPVQQLEDLKIPVHADLPVGEKLFDGITVPIRVYINESFTITPQRATSVISNLKFKLLGSGLLSSPSGLFGQMFTNTENSSFEKPNLGIFGMATLPERWSSLGWNLRPDVSKEFQILDSDKGNEEGFTLLVQLIKPKSRGNLTLKSANPFEQPSVDPQYLEEEEDIAALIKGIKLSSRILQTKSFRKLQPRLQRRPFSKCTKHKINSDPYLECVVRHLAVSSDNVGGTCKMGDTSDNTTVLDPQLRVKGIEQLRVVDASVFPSPPSAANYAPIVMLAEKAADIIKKTQPKKGRRKH